MISSFQSESEATNFYTESRKIMLRAGFNLRSWTSNSKTLRDIALKDNVLDTDEVAKVLGMKWKVKEDSMTYPTQTIPQEPEAISPSHLLYGWRIITLPYSVPPDTQTFPKSDSNTVRRRSKSVIQTIEQFRRHWQTEYLTALREHYSNTNHASVTIKVGNVVQIHDDKPRIQWKLDIVEELLTSNDGITRAVKLRTNNGFTNRPVIKLYPLEVTNEYQSEH